MIKQRRAERRRAYERQQRQWRWVKLGLTAFTVLAVVGIGWWIVRAVQDARSNQMPPGTVTYAYTSTDHTASLADTVSYAESPPVGGTHAPSPNWQNCGFYDQPVQNEAVLHSLEHGAVWITYRPDLPQDQVDILRAKGEQPWIVVSPYADNPTPVVATAWNAQLALDNASDGRLDQFIRFFRLSRNAPEPGGACSGGVGVPVAS